MFDFFRGDKRKHYRVPRGTDSSLSAELAVDANTLIKAQVIDTSVGGAGLVLSKEDARILSSGSLAAIAFRSDRAQRVVTTKARVVRISKAPGGTVVLGFQFIEPAALLEQLDTSWWSYFNRRESFRVRLDDQRGFEVNLITEGAVRRGLPLHDLSPEGLAVSVELADAPGFEIGAQFRLAFRLPKLENAMSLHAALVHVTAREESALLGLRFESDGTPDYDERYRQMVEYTLRLQARTPK